MAQVQTKFEGLAEKHEQTEQYLEQAKAFLGNISQVQEGFEQRFKELETKVKSQSQKVNAQVLDVCDEAKATLQDLVQAKKQFHRRLEDLEVLKTDLIVTLEQLAQYNPAYFKRINRLNPQLQGTKSSLNRLEKRLRTMRVWLTVSVLTATAALSVSISELIFGNEATFVTNNSIEQAEPKIKENLAKFNSRAIADGTR